MLPAADARGADSPTAARARCTCIRPRRWPRTRPGRSTRFGLHKQIRPAIYDGDTPRAERAAIRKRSNLVLTNPDMLHVGILPNHAAWDELLVEPRVRRRRRGARLPRRVRLARRQRAAAAAPRSPRSTGPTPRFLLASATIANPLELAERLTGLDDFNLIDGDGAPKAERRVAIWNPPLLDESLGLRGSALAEAAELFAELIAAGARTICFMKSRKGVELILRHARDRLDDELAERIAPYRAGYTPAQRQDIQRRLTEATCSASSRPTRSSSGSTSASSTPRSA